MTQEKLDEILESHGRWLSGKKDGERANLHGADLSCADLRGANLCGANLHGADLRGANLCGANLHGADLCGANLRGANLHGANLRCADLCGASLPKSIVQIGPIGSRRSYTVYNATDNIVQCGCWKGGTLDEFEKRIETVYPSDEKATLKYRKEYTAAIAFFRAMLEMETQKGKARSGGNHFGQ